LMHGATMKFMPEKCVMIQTKEGPQLAINASVYMLHVCGLSSVHLSLLNLITQLIKYLHAMFIC